MSIKYDGLTFERLGHASVRIETAGGTVIYIDPWSEVLDDEPRDGDVVLVTHDDMDHYDPDAIRSVASSDATVGAYERIDTTDLEVDVVHLPLEGTTTVRGIDVRSVPARNDPRGPHVDDEGNPFHAHGEVIGLLMTIDEAAVFYPADTDFLDEHATIGADVLIPPIGGHFTMDRHEAAELARRVDPELVLPVHYDTFQAIETDVGAFIDELERDDIEVVAF